MASSLSVKRDRDCLEWGREDEPLSKRINNLHLDSSNTVLPSLSSVCATEGQVGLQRGVHLANSGNASNSSGLSQSSHVVHNGLSLVQQQQLQFQQHANIPNEQIHYDLMQQNNQIQTENHLLQQQQQLVQQQLHQQQQLQHQHLIGHPSTHQLHLETLIANRELPESLSIHYPALSPSCNSYYYSANKVLHDLHIDRLRRIGKIQ